MELRRQPIAWLDAEEHLFFSTLSRLDMLLQRPVIAASHRPP
jgi:hypothetical protein